MAGRSKPKVALARGPRSGSRSREADRTSNHRILLVEDDPDRIHLTVRALEEQPIDVDVDIAKTGEDGLETLQDRQAEDDLPKLVLLDLKLPGLHGFEVLDRIREDPSTRYVPVVVLTSSREAEDRLESYRRGANGFVSRPVNFHDLREQMAKVGRFWLTVNEAPDHEA